MSFSFAFNHALFHLEKHDSVAVAKYPLAEGTQLVDDERVIQIRQAIPAGHKVALAALSPGEPILKYGQFIGIATQPIQPGDWVHTHNLALPEEKRTFNIPMFENRRSTADVPADRSSFLGYPRPDGSAGTRNLIAVIATVSCAAQTARQIAAHFSPPRLADFPNVDGVIAVTHHSGCGFAPHTVSFTYLQRTLTNLVRNPNIGGALLIGLGCEYHSVETCLPLIDAAVGSAGSIPSLIIQQQGGIGKTVAAGIAAVEEMLPKVNAVKRIPQPVSKLKMALQCGGSDGWSGITANPLVGRVSDWLAGAGGTAVLSETPEIYGAEFLLLNRAATPQAAGKLRRILTAWQEMAERYGFSLDNNPTPGNKAGGLTTIYEKSLGAVAKGGSTPLNAVYEYAERIEAAGLVFMDSPGNDLTSLTGMAAGGCNLSLFTTGRGTVATGLIMPCLKIATHTQLYERMAEDMDFNAGALLEGADMEELAMRLIERILAAASGEKSKGEAWGMREAEFIPWQLGCAL